RRAIEDQHDRLRAAGPRDVQPKWLADLKIHLDRQPVEPTSYGVRVGAHHSIADREAVARGGRPRRDRAHEHLRFMDPEDEAGRFGSRQVTVEQESEIADEGEGEDEHPPRRTRRYRAIGCRADCGGHPKRILSPRFGATTRLLDREAPVA